MLNTMYERAFGQAEGCMVLFSRGHYACAEALCRTVIESSTNLYYCAVGNTENKLASYFRQFLQDEREQNRKMACARLDERTFRRSDCASPSKSGPEGCVARGPG